MVGNNFYRIYESDLGRELRKNLSGNKTDDKESQHRELKADLKLKGTPCNIFHFFHMYNNSQRWLMILLLSIYWYNNMIFLKLDK